MTSRASRLLGSGPRAWAVAVTMAGLAQVPVVAWPGGPSGAVSTRQAPASHHATAVTPSDWTVYHGQPSGSGRSTSPTPLWPLHAAWTSVPLDGDLFGEPLVYGNRVFVATEDDTVYALSARTGHVLWSEPLAVPVPAADLPCGDIGPTVGITGTPVIDPAHHELFAVADELSGGSVHHVLYGLDTFTGRVELHQSVDPPGSTPPAQLQRTGLNLIAGQVVFGYGGNAGDCSTYHGWVVGVPEGGGAMRTFEVDPAPGEDQGAIWMGGAAPEVDQRGDVWVSAGNGSVTSAAQGYDRSDSVLDLGPRLHLRQFFAPSTWRSDNARDADLGSASPALLGNGLVVQAGKSDTAYLLDGAHLGGIGSQRAALPGFCGSQTFGGTAVKGSSAYLPCAGGVIRVNTAPPSSMAVAWRTPSGSGGSPVLAGRHVYTISLSSGSLFALSRGTGRVDGQFPLGPVANHFPTPTVADGLVLAASSDQVHAFDGPDGLPPKPTAPGSGTSPSP